MLKAPAPFPHIGSEAVIAATGEHARILQRNADGTCLLSLTAGRYEHEAASGNRTVPFDELRDPEALHPKPAGRGAKSGRKGKGK